jgi:hypothetical protein
VLIIYIRMCVAMMIGTRMVKHGDQVM